MAICPHGTRLENTQSVLSPTRGLDRAFKNKPTAACHGFWVFGQIQRKGIIRDKLKRWVLSQWCYDYYFAVNLVWMMYLEISMWAMKIRSDIVVVGYFPNLPQNFWYTVISSYVHAVANQWDVKVPCTLHFRTGCGLRTYFILFLSYCFDTVVTIWRT